MCHYSFIHYKWISLSLEGRIFKAGNLGFQVYTDISKEWK